MGDLNNVGGVGESAGNMMGGAGVDVMQQQMTSQQMQDQHQMQEQEQLHQQQHGNMQQGNIQPQVEEKLWLSQAVFHDNAILSSFAHVFQTLQLPPPVEETRKVGSSFVHKLIFNTQEIEGEATTKKQARRAAIRLLIHELSEEMTAEDRNKLCHAAAQQLILQHSRMGADALNVKFEMVDGAGNITEDASAAVQHTATVVYANHTVEGLGRSEIGARLAAYDR
jgi:hypothetical protein